MNRFRILAIAICALCLNIPNLWASSSSPELLEIQHQWAKANYELTDDTQEQAFVTLCVIILLMSFLLCLVNEEICAKSQSICNQQISGLISAVLIWNFNSYGRSLT